MHQPKSSILGCSLGRFSATTSTQARPASSLLSLSTALQQNASSSQWARSLSSSRPLLGGWLLPANGKQQQGQGQHHMPAPSAAQHVTRHAGPVSSLPSEYVIPITTSSPCDRSDSANAASNRSSSHSSRSLWMGQVQFQAARDVRLLALTMLSAFVRSLSYIRHLATGLLRAAAIWVGSMRPSSAAGSPLKVRRSDLAGVGRGRGQAEPGSH